MPQVAHVQRLVPQRTGPPLLLLVEPHRGQQGMGPLERRDPLLLEVPLLLERMGLLRRRDPRRVDGGRMGHGGLLHEEVGPEHRGLLLWEEGLWGPLLHMDLLQHRGLGQHKGPRHTGQQLWVVVLLWHKGQLQRLPGHRGLLHEEVVGPEHRGRLLWVEGLWGLLLRMDHGQVAVRRRGRVRVVGRNTGLLLHVLEEEGLRTGQRKDLFL